MTFLPLSSIRFSILPPPLFFFASTGLFNSVAFEIFNVELESFFVSGIFFRCFFIFRLSDWIEKPAMKTNDWLNQIWWNPLLNFVNRQAKKLKLVFFEFWWNFHRKGQASNFKCLFIKWIKQTKRNRSIPLLPMTNRTNKQKKNECE